MKTKWEMYKTAFWPERNEFVGLEKFHHYGNYYSIITISGERFNVPVSELDRFVL
jgi:hypothetical protein